MTYVRQCVDEGTKFAKIIYEKCSQLKKKSHNHLKSPGAIHLLNSRTVKAFASCCTVVQRLVIFTLTLVQKLQISNLKLSLINSVSLIQNITYTKWLHKKKI
jgi:hypothetical protein